jgi:hypothetical protein
VKSGELKLDRLIDEMHFLKSHTIAFDSHTQCILTAKKVLGYWQVMRMFDQPQRLPATDCKVCAVKLPDLPAFWHAVVTALL